MRVIQPAYGSSPFLAQQLAQEVMGTGAYIPRWRDRAAAYAAPVEFPILDVRA